MAETNPPIDTPEHGWVPQAQRQRWRRMAWVGAGGAVLLAVLLAFNGYSHHAGEMPVSDAHEICDRIEEALRDDVAGADVTIHVEPDGKAKHTGIVVL